MKYKPKRVALLVAGLLLSGVLSPSSPAADVVDGLSFAAPHSVNENAADDTEFGDFFPLAATDSNGTWLIVWSRERYIYDEFGELFSSFFDNRLYAVRSTDAAISWGAQSAIADIQTSRQHVRAEALAADPSGTWVAAIPYKGKEPELITDPEDPLGTDEDLVFIRSSDDAVTWSAPSALNLNGFNDTRHDRYPTLAGDGGGHWVAAWRNDDNDDIFVARSNDSAQTWSAPSILPGPGGFVRCDQPAAAADGIGSWAIVCNSRRANAYGFDLGSDDDLFQSWSSDEGATWSNLFPLNIDAPSDDDAGDDRASIATNRTGTWLAVWTRYESNFAISAHRAMVARSIDLGATWSAPLELTRLREDSRGSIQKPGAATDGDGNWIVAWIESGYTEPGDVYFSYVAAALSVDDGITWSEPIIISPAAHIPTMEVVSEPLEVASLSLVGGEEGRWLAVYSAARTDLGLAAGGDRDIYRMELGVCGDGVIFASEECDDGAGNNDSLADACRSSCRAAYCGDGTVDSGEACDDGNLSNADACLADCMVAICGDGFVHATIEECDDANASNTDGCLSSCIAATCGDGFVHVGVEECDDGDTNSDSISDACRLTCRLPRCGDAVVDTDEACDDGNAHNTDACLTNCADAVCGDGFVLAGVEECDDANGTNTDECLNTCLVATCGDGYVRDGIEECDSGESNSDTLVNACRTDCALPSCGDGIIDDGEECDDGNDVDSDDCLPSCKSASCGDGFMWAGIEQCDDGNESNNDGCLNACIVASCGDGFAWSDVEECDDGNLDNGDSCTTACRQASCGDGFVWQEEEACDDGNADNSDACITDCELARCGDGFVRAGVEECDDGNDSDVDSCLTTCADASCGDGWVWEGVEECDDGNVVNGDACDVPCLVTRCGNGVRTGAEQCDDGNVSNTDACLNNCEDATCGDGFTWADAEECDDGNVGDGDGCSRLCETQQLCGDASGDDAILASDALLVLRSSVGANVICPLWICDVNASGATTATDALRVLKRTVGLDVELLCGDISSIRIWLADSPRLGALQLEIDYGDAPGRIQGTGLNASCMALAANATIVFNNSGNGILGLSMLSLEGVRGPGFLAECDFIADANVVPDDFAIAVLDAVKPNGQEVLVPPDVAIVPY